MSYRDYQEVFRDIVGERGWTDYEPDKLVEHDWFYDEPETMEEIANHIEGSDDIMPSETCSALFIEQGSTYAEGVEAWKNPQDNP